MAYFAMRSHTRSWTGIHCVGNLPCDRRWGALQRRGFDAVAGTVIASVSLPLHKGLRMRLDPLVRPRSVAIVGATDRGGPGRAVMESLGAIGFTGPIYPVKPKYTTVLNVKCYPSLTDLPEPPDI